MGLLDKTQWFALINALTYTNFALIPYYDLDKQYNENDYLETLIWYCSENKPLIIKLLTLRSL